MSYSKGVTLTCEGVAQDLDTTEVNECMETFYGCTGSVSQARVKAKHYGWTFTKGRDYCHYCSRGKKSLYARHAKEGLVSVSKV